MTAPLTILNTVTIASIALAAFACSRSRSAPTGETAPALGASAPPTSRQRERAGLETGASALPDAGAGRHTSRPWLPERTARGPGPRIRFNPTKVDGDMPTELANTVLRSRRGAFRLCYVDALARRSKLEGRFVATFDVGTDGKVTGAKARSETTLRDQELLRCLIRNLSETQFPQPDEGSVHVTMSADFAPRSSVSEDASGFQHDAPTPPPIHPRADVLATDQNFPSAIAVDATHVYWTNSGIYREPNGSVMKTSLVGGPATTLASGQEHPSGIAVDRTSVYWTDWYAGTVKTVPIAGGEARTIVSGAGTPGDIVVDETSIYWADFGGRVMKAELSGGAPEALASGQAPSAIAVDRENVYWTDMDAGTVMKVPLRGGAVTTLAPVQGRANGIVVDGAHVYWTSGFGTVMRVPVAGGAPTRLALDQGGPDAIAVDATALYWANFSAGTIMKLGKADREPTTLAAGQALPVGLAVRSGTIFWANSGTTTVHGSIAKVSTTSAH